MTSVRSVVHPGWIEVTAAGVHAVVAAAERHAEVLTAAVADGGLVGLLEALTAHGLSGAPDLAAVELSDGPGEGSVRVVVRGSGSVVLGDGTRIGSEGRLPWRDLDVSAEVAGDEVSVEAPEPEVPRGWRRPARLGRPAPAVAATAAPEPPVEAEPSEEAEPVERDEIDQSGDRVPEDEPGRSEPVDAADHVPEDGAPERDQIALSDDVVPEDEDEDDDDVPGDAAPVQPDLTLPPPDEASAGLPPAARVPASAPPKGGLIESVPWRRGAGAPAAANPPTAELPVHTPPPPPADVVPPPPPTTASSDGPTDEAADRAEAAQPGPEATVQDLEPAPEAHDVPDEHAAPDVTTDRGALHRTDDDLDRPVVLAVLCPAGHPSPPHAGACRTCGREIPPQQPFQTARPSLGVLRISTGGVVPLDRGVLLGRAPRVNEELPPSLRPHLLRVGGVDRDISRNHAEVVLEGWHVLVRDLGSTNGTTVTLPGQEPVRLRPTEDHGIEPGAVITLADEVSLTYEVEG
ncbi:FHA domain-containing protein [Oryzobacter sp. R7]|uniref:FHA domain-containing protein n=1 Tax=Oryzobacter faecalis TaxID=3388656 RepID=UPI00398D55AD